MALFRLLVVSDAHRAPRWMLYDNETSSLTWEESGEPVLVNGERLDVNPDAIVSWSDSPTLTQHPSTPGKKSRNAKAIKISLGLSCNFSCTYCSQRFVPHADNTSRKDAEAWLEKLPSWYDGGENGFGRGTTFEFWGGEPLLYWAKVKHLAIGIRAAYPDAEFSIITNGSLLDEDKNLFLDSMGFSVAVSHDGPGQHVRGPDPLEDPKSRESILALYRRLKPSGRFSFNAMLNRENLDRAAIRRFFVDLTGDEDVPIGEGGFIDAYDQDAVGLSLTGTLEDRQRIRRDWHRQIMQGQAANFISVTDKMRDFAFSLIHSRPAAALGQKCGMDKAENIAVDLKGNVVTCQNVSAVSKNPAGQAHKIGHVDRFEDIALKTATHWSFREECLSCPVLQLCKGSCMFLTGELWDVSCNNAYDDNVALFAATIHATTGWLPIRIEGPQRAERFDIFGPVETTNMSTTTAPAPGAAQGQPSKDDMIGMMAEQSARMERALQAVSRQREDALNRLAMAEAELSMLREQMAYISSQATAAGQPPAQRVQRPDGPG